MSPTSLKALAQQYNGRISTLFSLGRNGLMNRDNQIDYIGKYGFCEEDIEELFALATDMELYYYDYSDMHEDEVLEFFAVIHAWHVLSQLEVAEAKQLFVEWFESYDFDNLDDWMISEFRTLIRPYRSEMFDYITSYVQNPSHSEWVRMEYIEVVKDMYEAKEINLEQLNTFLDKVLSTSNNPIVNAGAISVCMDHMLTEHHERIKQCFKQKVVDIDHIGDLEDVEIKMGLRVERETERELTELQKVFEPYREDFDRIFGREEEGATPYISAEPKIGRNEATDGYLERVSVLVEGASTLVVDKWSTLFL
jgi:hypothetical protein